MRLFFMESHWCVTCVLWLPERFCLMDIQGSPSYPALFQGLSQCFLVNQAASWCVYQESSLTHLYHRVRNSMIRLWGATEGCTFQSAAKYNSTNWNHFAQINATCVLPIMIKIVLQNGSNGSIQVLWTVQTKELDMLVSVFAGLVYKFNPI